MTYLGDSRKEMQSEDWAMAAPSFQHLRILLNATTAVIHWNADIHLVQNSISWLRQGVFYKHSTWPLQLNMCQWYFSNHTTFTMRSANNDTATCQSTTSNCDNDKCTEKASLLCLDLACDSRPIMPGRSYSETAFLTFGSHTLHQRG